MTFWKKLSNRIMRVPLWTVGLGTGIIFWGIGLCGEQFADFYRKAVMICLECIGIG